MKIDNQRILFLALSTLLLSSCTSLLYTSLDVLLPAKIAFAPEASNLLIVNNAAKQPSFSGHITRRIDEKATNALLNTDSLPIFCLAALKEELADKNFFSSVQLTQNTQNNTYNNLAINALNKDSVRKLCFKNQSDVILSLDKMKITDDLNEYYLRESNASYLSTLDVNIETSWSIHYPNKSEGSAIQFKDTIYWESESYSLKICRNNLPKRMDALIDGALYVGQKSGNRFVPYWEKVDRYFFDSRNKLMKRGMDSVYVKNWKSAIDNWEAAMKKTNKKLLKAQAANNIAIAYEIIGNIDKALEYATLSYYTFGSVSFIDYNSYFRILQYANELTERKKDIEILKKQLENNNTGYK